MAHLRAAAARGSSSRAAASPSRCSWAALLDRLHVAVAPLLIGDGRPAIRLPARAALGECHRPKYRVFRMGGDILFDCELAEEALSRRTPTRNRAVTRVI
jgi:hypothetical protein